MSGETMKAMVDFDVFAKGVRHEVEHVGHAVKDLRRRVDDLKRKTTEVLATLPPDTTIKPDYSALDGAMATLEGMFGDA